MNELYKIGIKQKAQAKHKFIRNCPETVYIYSTNVGVNNTRKLFRIHKSMPNFRKCSSSYNTCNNDN